MYSYSLYLTNYENTIKVESLRAYKVFLLSQPMFYFDAKGLGLNKKKIKKEIKNKLMALRKDLLKKDSALQKFFDDYSEEKTQNEFSTFLFELYSLLIMTIYLHEKYTLQNKSNSLNKQKLADNLAISIIEGSAIGRYCAFTPYFSREDTASTQEMHFSNNHKMINYPRDTGFNRHDDFYYAQNSFLQHQLLMLVVLYNRWEILPNIKYSKIAQKNIITSCIEDTSNDIPDDFIDNDKWTSSLVNIIKNFDFIMTHLQDRRNRRAITKLANIFFSKEFIHNFNFDELLHSYIFQEDRQIDTIPTAEKVSDTVGKILDARIQEYISNQSAWRHVVNFTKFFPLQVATRKNTHMDFSDGDTIYIFNNAREFGISIKDYIAQDRLTYEELTNEFDMTKYSKSMRAEKYFLNTYIF